MVVLNEREYAEEPPGTLYIILQSFISLRGILRKKSRRNLMIFLWLICLDIIEF